MQFSIFSIIVVLAGAALEYYDYMLFSIMIPIISPIFSDSSSSHAILTSGYLIMFLGALMRPLGGIIIGYIGDKKGRDVALFWSMMIMSASSFMIAFLPSYAQIGAWAAFALFFCRMLQTMSAASELNGVAIFLIEMLDVDKKKSRKGLASGLAWSFTVLGMLGASIASYYSDVTNWRLPFLIGGGIALFAMMLRWLPKTHANPAQTTDLTNFNFVRSVIASILIAAGISGMFYYNMIWIPGYLQCEMDPILVRKFSIYYFILYSLMLLISGIISDYVKKMHRIMMIATILIAIFAIPTIFFKNMYFNMINVILLAVYIGPSHAILFQLFPKEYRCRGVSITYSIGTSIIGGMTPFICSKFAPQFKYFPAFWLIFVASIAFSGMFIGRKLLIKN